MDVHGGFHRHLEIWGRRNSSDDCHVHRCSHCIVSKIVYQGFDCMGKPTANCCVNFSGNRATRHDVGITESLRSTSRSLGSNVFSCIFPRTEFSGCSLAINLAATCVVNQVYVKGCEICQIVAEISSELVAIKVCHHESHESCSADPF